jgi:hypothetical protein
MESKREIEAKVREMAEHFFIGPSAEGSFTELEGAWL